MTNDFSKLTDAELAARGTTVKSAISGKEASYGLVALDTTILTGDLGQLTTSMTAADNAKAAAHAAIQTKEAARTVVLNDLSSLANRIYAHPGITETLIVAAGLAPRSSARVKVTPRQPGVLAAVPDVAGEVKLTWQSGGNKYGVNYLVESKTSQDGEWSLVLSTTKRSVALSGYTAGSPAWFRVKATKNEMTSLPSNEFVIYPAGSSEADLTIAA